MLCLEMLYIKADVRIKAVNGKPGPGRTREA